MNMTSWIPYADNTMPNLLKYIREGLYPGQFSLVAYCDERYKSCCLYSMLWQLETA